MESSSFIETELHDILTLDSCITLVSELIKFILYRKQQLPYTFDRLKYLISKRNVEDNHKTSANVYSFIERQFRVAKNGLATLELLFEKTKQEFADTKNGRINEVALLFGSTPMTPKQVYIIHLPEVSLDHYAINHPERKHLFQLLQSVILSNNLSNMLTKPMNPTNMYVFIKKKGCILNNSNSVNDWFIPKKRYQIPKIGQHFHIKFLRSNSQVAPCDCKRFKIYHDEKLTPEKSQDRECLEINAKKKENICETEWYQACTSFQGFADVYVNGVSVADLWLR